MNPRLLLSGMRISPEIVRQGKGQADFISQRVELMVSMDELTILGKIAIWTLPIVFSDYGT